jgi:16S rRNA (guanine1207-N2)-methyltransferase
MSIPKNHYFNPTPSVASKPHTVRLRVKDEIDVALQADRGVFGSRRVDLGTEILLREAPAPPASGDVLDLGAGYGPIAILLARRSPETTVWAVDVNERAVQLAAANAEIAGTRNIRSCRPDEVPGSVRFAAIYSNPPVRVGKAALHELLERWLARLTPEGRAYLVVQRNLGADSLTSWLNEAGFPARRLKSKKGYRVLEVGSRTQE